MKSFGVTILSPAKVNCAAARCSCNPVRAMKPNKCMRGQEGAHSHATFCVVDEWGPPEPAAAVHPVKSHDQCTPYSKTGVWDQFIL